MEGFQHIWLIIPFIDLSKSLTKSAGPVYLPDFFKGLQIGLYPTSYFGPNSCFH